MRHDKENVEDKLIFISLKHNAKPLINQCDACSPMVDLQTDNSRKVNDTLNLRFLLEKKIIKTKIDRENIAYLAPSNLSFSVLDRKAKNILNAFRLFYNFCISSSVFSSSRGLRSVSFSGALR